MNEMTLVAGLGAEAPEPSADEMRAAEARLLVAIRGRSGGPVPFRRPTVVGRRRLIAATATAATALAAACVVGVTLPRLDTGWHDDPRRVVTLVAFDTPAFPLALQPRPVGVTAPTFSGGEHDGRRSMTAVYLADNGRDDVYLGVGDGHLPQAPPAQTRPVMVGAVPGQLTLDPDPVLPRATLSWQRAPAQWVVLVGNGRFATEAAIRSLAATVITDRQPVPLQIRLAPAGWHLTAYKDDRILRLDDPASGDELTVDLTDRPEPGPLRPAGGVPETHTVRVQDRDGLLERTASGWSLRIPLADGRLVHLQAPASLTGDQVTELGGQIAVAPRPR